MFSALDISTSALVAQRTRLNAISSNLANMSTTRNEAGELAPYQPRFAVFQTDDAIQSPEGAVGVQVSSIEFATSEPLWKYQPGHPDAQQEGPKKGWVAYPDVNMVQESVDALEATRAYEANIGVIEVTKNLNQTTLRILA
ncbi:MAG: flagellar basal body rod protein FlgC [Planctomycetota bacterium]|nr:flagellar basal body rod protein FlgC [Planctomycetota bacterium]